MPTSPDRGAVLKGGSVVLPVARLDMELRDSVLLQEHRADPRLVDPTLERAFDRALTLARTVAHEQGYADGLTAGQAAAAAAAAQAEAARRAAAADRERARDHALDRALQGLQALTAALADQLDAGLAASRDAVLAGALDLAEVVLARELTLRASPGLDALTRALSALPDSDAPVLVARLHPQDAATIGELPLPDPRVRVVADPQVPVGGCVLDAGCTQVDARLDRALARVREALQ